MRPPPSRRRFSHFTLSCDNRLFPDARGFECLLPLGEGLHPDDLSLPHLQQPGRLRDIEQHLASSPLGTPRAQDQNPVVPQVPELLGSRLERRPIPPYLLDPLPYSLDAVVGRSLEDGHDRDPLDLRVEQPVKVGGPFRDRPVECLEAPASELDVLLRRRPQYLALARVPAAPRLPGVPPSYSLMA